MPQPTPTSQAAVLDTTVEWSYVDYGGSSYHVASYRAPEEEKPAKKSEGKESKGWPCWLAFPCCGGAAG